MIFRDIETQQEIAPSMIRRKRSTYDEKVYEADGETVKGTRRHTIFWQRDPANWDEELLAKVGVERVDE